MDYFHREIRTDVGVDYYKAKMKKKCDVLEYRQIQSGHYKLNDCAINSTNRVGDYLEGNFLLESVSLSPKIMLFNSKNTHFF